MPATITADKARRLVRRWAAEHGATIEVGSGRVAELTIIAPRGTHLDGVHERVYSTYREGRVGDCWIGALEEIERGLVPTPCCEATPCDEWDGDACPWWDGEDA